MLIGDVQEAGLLVPYGRMSTAEVQEARYRLLDGLLALIGGAVATPEADLRSLREALGGAGAVRPVFPLGVRTSLEAAAFLNGFLIRQADWGDTYWLHGIIRGHPSDQVAAILALADDPELPGERIVELVHLAYRLWEAVYAAMPGLEGSGWDYTTVLALTVPVLAGVRAGASPERIEEAVRLSASGGMLLGQVRAGDITNWKSGATGYAVARALGCYQLSRVLTAPPSLFDGARGWNSLVAPLAAPLRGASGEPSVYASVDVKAYPCFHVAQGAVACGLALHPRLADGAARVRSLTVWLSEHNERIANRPERRRIPTSPSAADHHVGYCVATALLHGALTPRHYERRYLESEATRALLERASVRAFPPDSVEAAGEGEACMVEVVLDDGQVLRYAVERPRGAFHGLSTEARLQRLGSVLEEKRRLAEQACGRDLGPLVEVVQRLEAFDGQALIERVQEVLSGVAGAAA